MTTTTSEGKVEPACPKACSSCPWRLANQGSKPDLHKFYSPSNLKRLWTGLRNGARMSCHPTDPRMAEFAGYEALADREITHECTGSLILVQREAMLFQKIAEENPESKKVLQLYRKQRPQGLTRDGLIALVNRQMFGSFSGTKMTTPNLINDEVGYPLLEKAK